MLNKTVFHGGDGLNIFDNINQELESLNNKREELEKKVD